MLCGSQPLVCHVRYRCRCCQALCPHLARRCAPFRPLQEERQEPDADFKPNLINTVCFLANFVIQVGACTHSHSFFSVCFFWVDFGKHTVGEHARRRARHGGLRTQPLLPACMRGGLTSA